MRRKGIAWVLALVLLAALLPSQALARGGHHRHPRHHGHHWSHHGHHGGHFFFGIGPAYYWGPPWWYRHHYTTTVIVEEEQPPVYIERRRGGWWYYCGSEGAYYPSVETCPEPWVRVAPRPE